jgi:glutamate transport system permease protein
MNFFWQFVAVFRDHLPEMTSGLVTSLQITVIAVLGAFLIGTITAIYRISPIGPLRMAGTIYVEIFRNIPVMSLLILIVYALPGTGIRFGFYRSVLIGLSLVGGAFVCEALRSGINSVQGGQIEAARAIGLGFTQVLRLVVLPQAFRAMVQPMVTVIIGLFLSSSLAGVVGVLDLTQSSNRVNTLHALGLAVYAAAAIFYVAIALLIAWVGGRIERAVRILR